MVRKRRKSYLFLIFIIFIVLLGYFLSKLSIFERNAPEILVNDVIYNNLKNPILVNVKDSQSGIKNVKIILKKDTNDNGVIVADEKIDKKQAITLKIPLPKLAYKEKVSSYFMEIEVSDASFWNFLRGNRSKKNIHIIIDDTNPSVNILSNSYKIEQGGAASVVFSASDANLDKVYIQTNKDKIFKATPYVKQGYYVALIAWDAKDDYFRAYVIAKDKAGNETKEQIHYYFLNRKYRVSNINLNDKFLNGKIENLAQQYAPKDNNFTRFEKFKFVNETLRISNEELIHKITSELLEEKIDDFNLNLFLPLKNAAKVGDFADHRYYFYNGNFISDSYHMGLDLASVAQAPIVSNNAGKVVFANENGIYGLNLIIYHGLGLYTLYGHCSSKEVEVGQNINKQSTIARTGMSGLALGDHLHFGVLVQGVETRPEQWQDKNWLNNNIFKVLNDGKKMILEGN